MPLCKPVSGLLVALFLSLSVYCVSATEAGFVPNGRCVIAYGDTAAMLGVSGGADDRWTPLFFTVLGDGSIAIPDYFKGRIAVYSGSGEFKSAIAVDGSVLSSRLNYFGSTGSGQFILFNDSVLYCLDSAGSVLWNTPFPMGVFPQAILSGQDAVWFSLSGASGSTGVSVTTVAPFAASERTASVAATNGDPITIPFVESGSYRFGFSANDTRALRSDVKQRFDGSVLGDRARLLALSPSSLSLWVDRDDASFRLYALDAAGAVLTSAMIAANGDSSWYWAVGKIGDAQASVYLYEPSDDVMTITRYDAAIGKKK